jgi:hypothetical protein
MILGPCNNIAFNVPVISVSAGAAATAFVPVGIDCNGQWNASVAVTAATVVSALNFSIPSNIVLNSPTFDGCLMGVSATAAGIEINQPIFQRYSDLQDSGGGTAGGTNQWFAVPHALYLKSLTIGAVSFPCSHVLTDVLDYGVYVGGVTRRTTISGANPGFLNSAKMEIENGSSVNGYTSFRPDGGLDFGANNLALVRGGTASGVFSFYNSSVTAGVGGGTTGLRWSAVVPYQAVFVDGVELYDSAVVPISMPMAPVTMQGSSQTSITNLKMIVQDCPTSVFWPGIGIPGDEIDAEITFINHTGTTHNQGAVYLAGSTWNTNSNYKIKLKGWRRVTVAFTAPAPLASGAVAGTLASGLPVGNSVYPFRFSDGEVRAVTVSEGLSTACAWTGYPLTANVTATVSVLSNNLDGVLGRLQQSKSAFLGSCKAIICR